MEKMFDNFSKENEKGFCNVLTTGRVVMEKSLPIRKNREIDKII